MLEVGNVILNVEVEEIIDLIQEETEFLKDVNIMDNDIMVTCPFHKGGMENKPSLGVSKDSGVYHCFTCGEKGTIVDLVSYTLDISPQQAIRKLSGEFVYNTEKRVLDIELVPKRQTNFNKKVETLKNNKQAIAYLQSRNIPDLSSLYPIGYNPIHKSIVFYVQDLNGRIVYAKERGIYSKRFYNTADVRKADYLYGAYQIAKYWDGHSPVWICESEIDALTCWGRGCYAVAIGGSHISNNQLKILKQLGIKTLINGLDRDDAGRTGWQIIKKFSKGILLYDTIFPVNKKDINDLTKDEFFRIKILNNLSKNG